MTNAATIEKELSVTELDAVAGGLAGELGGIRWTAGHGSAGFSVGGIGVLATDTGHGTDVTFGFGKHHITVHV